MKVKTNILTIQNFRGIDNISHPLAVPLGYFVSADSVVVNDTGVLTTVPEYELVFTGTDIHSPWSNHDITLFMDGTSLYCMYTDNSVQFIGDLNSKSSVVFVDTEDGRIWGTNNEVVFFIKDHALHQPRTPSERFKKIMPPGHDIEYYRGTLFIARDNVVYYSDPYDYGIMDERYNYIQFNGRITLLKACYDGLYVGTHEGVYYLGGAEPTGFSSIKVSNDAPKEGSGIRFTGNGILKDISGTVVLWVGEDGIYLGLSGGSVRQITQTFSAKHINKAVMSGITKIHNHYYYIAG